MKLMIWTTKLKYLEKESTLYLVTEYCNGGTLEQYRKNCKNSVLTVLFGFTGKTLTYNFEIFIGNGI